MIVGQHGPASANVGVQLRLRAAELRQHVLRVVEAHFGQAARAPTGSAKRDSSEERLITSGEGEPISRSPPSHRVACGNACRNVRTMSECSNAVPGETHWTMIPFGDSDRATSEKYSTEYRFVAPASYGCTTSAVITSYGWRLRSR